MKREDLIRDLRRFARKNNLEFAVLKDRGAGSHYMVRLGDDEAIVSGATREEAAQAMRDALTAAVRGRIKLGLDLVPPAAPAADEREVFILPAALAAKAALYTAWKASGLSKVALGARIGCAEEVRRILDPDYPTGLARREQVARALGVELVVGARPAAAVAT